MTKNKLTWYVHGASRIAHFEHTRKLPEGWVSDLSGTKAPSVPQRGMTVGGATADSIIAPQADTTKRTSTQTSAASSPFGGQRGFIFYNYDHLGNTRLTYSATVKLGDEPGQEQYTYTAETIHDYDPYGKILRSFTKSQEKYLTTGHERDTETDLDYRGARFYDSEVVRFLSLDPLAAKYANLSAYMYVAGNPVAFVDKDGRDVSPSDAFKQGKYFKTYEAMKNNSVWKKYTSDFQGKDHNYNLDMSATIRGNGHTDPYDEKGGIIGNLALANGQIVKDVKSEFGSTKAYKDPLMQVGLLLHEAMHAYLFLHTKPNKPEPGKPSCIQQDDGQHDYISTNLMGDMIAGLKEYIKTNKLKKLDGTGYTESEINAVAWKGLTQSSYGLNDKNRCVVCQTEGFKKLDTTEQSALKASLEEMIKKEKEEQNKENLGGTPASE